MTGQKRRRGLAGILRPLSPKDGAKAPKIAKAQKNIEAKRKK